MLDVGVKSIYIKKKLKNQEKDGREMDFNQDQLKMEYKRLSFFFISFFFFCKLRFFISLAIKLIIGRRHEYYKLFRTST